MNEGLPSALCLVLLTAVFMFFMLFLLSWIYYNYIRSTKRKEKYVYISYSVPFIIILMIIISLHAGIMESLIFNLVFILIFVAVLLSLRTQFKVKCIKEEDASIEGINYKICYTDVINAWYHPKKRKIYVSNKLHEVLERDELKAILLHEQGHAESKILKLFNVSAMLLWYWGLSLIFTVIRLVVYSVPANLFKIASVVTLILLIPPLTLIAIMASWISEHEADVKALEETNVQTIASALVKSHAYSALQRYMKYIESVKFNDQAIVRKPEVSFKIVLWELFKQGFLKAPLELFEFLKNPVYTTHPPLELRLAKVLISRVHN